MDKLKKDLIEVYGKTYGNISATCRAVGISRPTFYLYKKEDAEFAQALKDAEPDEVLVDLAEEHLAKKIEAGDTAAIIFTLKTKGKPRGYVERTEHMHGEVIEQPLFQKPDDVNP